MLSKPVTKVSVLNFCSTKSAIFATERQTVVGKVEEDLVALYEKIRSEHGNGAGLFSHGTCNSCQIQISPSEINNINATDPEEIVRCENCRCVLVRN